MPGTVEFTRGVAVDWAWCGVGAGVGADVAPGGLCGGLGERPWRGGEGCAAELLEGGFLEGEGCGGGGGWVGGGGEEEEEEG